MKRVVWSLVLVVVLVAASVFVVYRRQIVSYLTHWKGGPSTTVPYEAFTDADAPLLHLAVAGDTGDSGSKLDALGARVAATGALSPQSAYDELLLLGDLIYPSGDPAALPRVIDEPFAGVFALGTELLAILGNHDVKLDRGDEIMATLGMPGRWWSWTSDDGSVLIVGLDSTDWGDAEQLAFLESTLASSTAPWKIVAVHHPPYSAGYQGSSLDVRDVLAPIAAEHGVQLVLSGHDHDYQRSEVIDGVTYVVSGAGSGIRRTGEDDFTEVAYAFVHFVDIGVFADRMVLRAVGLDGRVADTAVIPRVPV